MNRSEYAILDEKSDYETKCFHPKERRIRSGKTTVYITVIISKELLLWRRKHRIFPFPFSSGRWYRVSFIDRELSLRYMMPFILWCSIIVMSSFFRWLLYRHTTLHSLQGSSCTFSTVVYRIFCNCISMLCGWWWSSWWLIRRFALSNFLSLPWWRDIGGRVQNHNKIHHSEVCVENFCL